MAQPNLTLDDFLSRFQLLRPQLHPTAANARQAAVLVPVVRREQRVTVDTALAAITKTRRAGRLSRRGR